ncbi:hypothetical protein DMH18_25420 [Streptomyces sp. WAC 06783]|nr:hypothetical protein DMH18_25420 [Streptomyces sp. WAC 06783]
MREVPLPGGSVHAVVRVGRTVRRPATPRSGFVRDLLRHFERHGWPGAPRHLGSDEAGRDVMDYVNGHVAWEPVQLSGLGSGGAGARVGVTDATGAARRMRLICDGYGMVDRDALVATVLWWQDRCASGIEAAADAGDPAMVRLRAAGAVGEVRAARRWVAAHRGELERLLR